MQKNFYFRPGAEIVSGSAVFARQIGQKYAELSLTLEQAEAYAAVDAAFRDLYSLSERPATRTRVVVEQKNVSKRVLQREAMRLAQIIGASPNVSDSQLVALGLLPRRTHTRQKLTAGRPHVFIENVDGRRVTFRIQAADGDAPAARMPRGAVAAEVFAFVGEQPPESGRDYDYMGLAFRELYVVDFPDDVSSGATAWVSAAWVGKRGRSPGSEPRTFTIQGGAPGVGKRGVVTRGG